MEYCSKGQYGRYCGNNMGGIMLAILLNADVVFSIKLELWKHYGGYCASNIVPAILCQQYCASKIAKAIL